MSDFPVPLAFRLPGDRWAPVPPASLDVANAHFLAVRRGTAGGYTPTISISGDYRQDGSALPTVADESLVALGLEASGVVLLERREVGSEEAPGISQLLGGTISVEDRDLDVRQCQVLLDLRDAEEPRRRAVAVLTMTCLREQLAPLLEEFQRFVASVRPAAGAASG